MWTGALVSIHIQAENKKEYYELKLNNPANIGTEIELTQSIRLFILFLLIFLIITQLSQNTKIRQSILVVIMKGSILEKYGD